MEQNIQDLVASIRKEGIDKARKEADAIISKAKEEAEGIIREAEKSRDKMIADAEKAISLERTSSEAAIRQAARDVSLSLKKSIEDEYTRILSGKIAAELDKDGLIAIIKAVLSGDMGGKAVELNQKDLEALGSSLKTEFADEIAKGLEFRPSQRVASGFRISEKDGSGYMEISPDKCQELIYPYLSDTLKKLI